MKKLRAVLFIFSSEGTGVLRFDHSLIGGHINIWIVRSLQFVFKNISESLFLSPLDRDQRSEFNDCIFFTRRFTVHDANKRVQGL